VEFSERVDALEPSATLALAARARALREEGRSIVDLSAGEPVWDTPGYAARAAIDAIEAGKTGYPPTPGIPELRSAAAEFLTSTTRRTVDPGEVLVSNGVKHALFNCVFSLFGPGDEVLVPAPYWTSYLPQIHLAGAEPVVVPTRWGDGFRPDPDLLEQHRTDRTRGLLLNSPGNPTGAVLPLSLMQEIASWADRHGLWILSDEIYRQLNLGDGLAPSLFELEELPERSVVLDGVSKSFAMPGFRIGWAAGPRELISRAANLQSQTTSGASCPSQHAAAAAVGGSEREEAVGRFRRRLRDAVETSVEGLGDIPGMEVRAPEGGMFLFTRVRDADTGDVAERLLVDAGVAAVPGEAFGAPGHLRFNLAVEADTLREGMRRVRDYFGG